MVHGVAFVFVLLFLFGLHLSEREDTLPSELDWAKTVVGMVVVCTVMRAAVLVAASCISRHFDPPWILFWRPALCYSLAAKPFTLSTSLREREQRRRENLSIP